MAMGVAQRRVLVPELTQPPRVWPFARRYDFCGQAFATGWKVTLLTEGSVDVAALQARLEACLETIDAQMSPYRADSDLCRFNAATPRTLVALPEPFATVLGHARDMAALTDGAYDPGLLDAVEAWGFGAKAVPEGLPEMVAPTHSWRDLIWRIDGVVHTGVRLDLCGIAKGYACDAMMEIVRAQPGCVAALIEVGGELKGFGVQGDGQPWWVSIDGLDAVIALHEMAVATSGDGVRAFVHDGRLYSHTIDSRTGAPTTSDVRSATVLDAHAWRADALATALIVMGSVKALAFAAQHDIACLLRVHDGETVREVLSPALEAWL